jgi:DNA-binding transcriptional ArsR family regulator
VLRDGERTVSELQEQLGIDGSGVSQQLAVLRTRNIVDGRKNGLTVRYQVRDPEIFRLLDVAREIFNNQLIDLQAMMAEHSLETAGPRRSPRAEPQGGQASSS